MGKRTKTFYLQDETIELLETQTNMSFAIDVAVQAYYNKNTPDNLIEDICGQFYALEVDKKSNAIRTWPLYNKLSKLEPSDDVKSNYDETMVKMKAALKLE